MLLWRRYGRIQEALYNVTLDTIWNNTGGFVKGGEYYDGE